MAYVEFRWLALIALWTMLSGPMLAPPAHRGRGNDGPAASSRPVDRQDLTQVSKR